MTFGESPLQECWHKIERAKEHLDEIKRRIKEFLDSEPYALVEEYNSLQCKYLFKLNVLKPIPQTRWALIIGDCVHNVRTALDYLAWRLAGSEPADRDTLFPIFTRMSDFDKARWRLKRIDPRAIAEICEFQPYTRPNPERDALWFLRELDVRDKHKLLTMTETMTHAGTSLVTFSGDTCSDTTWNLRARLDEGAIVAQVRFPSGTLVSNVGVNIRPIYDIAFERGIFASSRLYPVNTYLSKIIKTVDDIIIRFEKLLSEHPNWIP